ncbi:MAG: PQQ-dependent sugar dehydrogenase [Planctomycetaceae bacterium]
MRRRLLPALLALIALAPVSACSRARTPWLAAGFPTNLAFAPDGRLFYTEKDTGRVRVVSAAGDLLPTPFAAFRVGSAGETGLLGIALDLRFAAGRPWVVLYLSDAATGRNELVRVRADGDVGARVQVLQTFLPTAGVYHNGGDLLFASDGDLYVTVGEAHQGERAQDTNDVGGKVLRLTPEGRPAPGNPFGPGNPVFTYGHRNSFGLCQDPATGEIWETENGPDVNDEVNRLTAGADYGWPVVTGDSGGRFQDPVAVFHDTVALTGCAWWRGALYVGSYKDGLVRRIDTATGEATTTAAFPTGVTDLAVGPDGDLYVAAQDGIYRLTAATATASVSPARADGGASARTWIAVVALVALVFGLGLRVWGGRRLRRAGRT